MCPPMAKLTLRVARLLTSNRSIPVLYLQATVRFRIVAFLLAIQGHEQIPAPCGDQADFFKVSLLSKRKQNDNTDINQSYF